MSENSAVTASQKGTSAAPPEEIELGSQRGSHAKHASTPLPEAANLEAEGPRIPGQGRLPLRDIDSRALDIVNRLQDRGFEAYLVGGCVRDLLAGVKPKDFDIATSALPQQIRKAVPFCVIIGRRFKLVLARRGDQQFEVATFRRQMSQEELESAQTAVETGQEAVVGDNFFGTSEEDARRRDFTINGLFYDPRKDMIIDYVQGMRDINTRTLRMIGDSETRFREDPIRILRALRLAHKLNFSLAPELRGAIVKTSFSLREAILPRKREEYLKILKLEDPVRALLELYDLNVLQVILPSLVPLIENEDSFLTFSYLIQRSREVGFDMNSPLEVMSVFLYCYFRSLYQEDSFEQIRARVQSDENLSRLKDEFGVFKSEAQYFTSCLDNYLPLSDPERYKKKGERRQTGFIHQDCVPLAFRLFCLDHSFSATTQLFWVQELTKHELLQLDPYAVGEVQS